MNEKEKKRFEQQLEFIRTLDRLKSVFRRTYLLDSSRTENSAEHSWQIALMALVLAEYADEPGVDLPTVVKMLLVHDVVEIEAGDTYLYDERAMASQAEREEKAAGKIFGILPPDQRRVFEGLWREFETGATPSARFARAVDRFQPLYHNYLTEGKTWREHGVRADRVRQIKEIVGRGSAVLADLTKRLIDESVRLGYFPE